MTPFIDLGGHSLKLSEDRYADGRKCHVAEHPDLPGCIVYAESIPAALEALKEARSAFKKSMRLHEGAQTPHRGTAFTTISGGKMLQPS